MDAPPIQYAKTADGVNIAYWAIGEGPPLVILPNLTASHLQLEWEQNDRRTAFERLAKRATVIRYDWRGMGLSQGESFATYAETPSLDLEAVVDQSRRSRSSTSRSRSVSSSGSRLRIARAFSHRSADEALPENVRKARDRVRLRVRSRR